MPEGYTSGPTQNDIRRGYMDTPEGRVPVNR
jgi:hypothetical protein